MAFVPAPNAVLVGKYRLARRLAGGGMGSVWLAHHLTLDAEVAVKLMASEVAETPLARSRFEREAKSCAQLRSPHIVKVFDYGLQDGTPFMVMELLEGEDLATRLAQRATLTLGEAAVMTAQLAKALRVAHEAGIVHRDIKPSNIFFAKEGDDEVVKLVDFGVVRETRTVLVDDPTSSGVVIGSPHHMSPEQARGEKVGPRSDLWSLGVVLFRALTGQRPFSGDGVAAVLLQVVSGPIPSAVALRPTLPTVLDSFFSRALSREVGQRFQDVGVLARALELIAAGGEVDRLLESPVSSRHPEPTVPVPSISSSSRGEDSPHRTQPAPGHSSMAAQRDRSSTPDSGAPPVHAARGLWRHARWATPAAIIMVSSVAAAALVSYALSPPSSSSAPRSTEPRAGGDALPQPPSEPIAAPHGSAEVIVSPTRSGASVTPTLPPSAQRPVKASASSTARLPPASVPSSAKRCAETDAFTGLCVSP